MEQINVKILGRDYRLAVQPEERDNLLESVRLVDEKMRGIRDSAKVSGVDRIAVMAALQLAHELLVAKRPVPGSHDETMLRKVKALNATLDEEVRRQAALF